jgi:hypothetical protein
MLLFTDGLLDYMGIAEWIKALRGFYFLSAITFWHFTINQHFNLLQFYYGSES